MLLNNDCNNNLSYTITIFLKLIVTYTNKFFFRFSYINIFLPSLCSDDIGKRDIVVKTTIIIIIDVIKYAFLDYKLKKHRFVFSRNIVHFKGCFCKFLSETFSIRPTREMRT